LENTVVKEKYDQKMLNFFGEIYLAGRGDAESHPKADTTNQNLHKDWKTDPNRSPQTKNCSLPSPTTKVMFLYIAKHGNMNIVRYIETIQMLPI
jgi:hypothetical protein